MRKSNIELMRILLFVMVVCIHVCSPFLNSNHIVSDLSWQFTNLIDGFSRVSVNGFVIISCYFLYTRRNTAKSRLKSLLIPLCFYLIPYLFLYIKDSSNIWAFYYLFKDLLDNQTYLYHLWYLQVLLIIHLLADYFNLLIDNLDKAKHKSLIVILLVFSSFIPTICYLVDYQFVDTSLFSSRLTLFITLYFIGAYINKYNLSFNRFKLFISFMIAEIAVVLFTFIYNYKTSPIILALNLRGIELSYPFPGFIGAFYDFNNIVIILASVTLFLFFRSLDFKSKAINYISKKTYGAYILHIFWINILSEIYYLNPYVYYGTIYYPAVLLIFIFLVSFCSICSVIIIDVVREKSKFIFSKSIKFIRNEQL